VPVRTLLVTSLLLGIFQPVFRKGKQGKFGSITQREDRRSLWAWSPLRRRLCGNAKHTLALADSV
jgi:hypothetical protein